MNLRRSLHLPLAVSLAACGIAREDTSVVANAEQSMRGIKPAAKSDLTIANTHADDFVQGQRGATYTITVRNIGSRRSSGKVRVTDALPPGLSAVTIRGRGWHCALDTLTCVRSDGLEAGASYPAITLKVDVASQWPLNMLPVNITNHVTVSGGGDADASNNTASDPTAIVCAPGNTCSAPPAPSPTPAPTPTPPPSADLTIVKTHSGDFFQAQAGATFTIIVSNIGVEPSEGAVSVADTPPPGLRPTAIAGEGWNCALDALTCSRSDSLAAGRSYPAITLTVDVAGEWPLNMLPVNVTNHVTVSGGGDANASSNAADDSVDVLCAPGSTCSSGPPAPTSSP